MTRVAPSRSVATNRRRAFGCGSFAWLLVLAGAAAVLWQVALPLIGVGGSANALGVVTLLFALLCTAAAIWLLVRLLLAVQLWRLLMLFALLFLLAVGLGLRQRRPAEPALRAIVTQTYITAQAWALWPVERAQDVFGYFDRLSLTVTGRRRAPRLPDIYPTPDANATPVRVVVPRDQ